MKQNKTKAPRTPPNIGFNTTKGSFPYGSHPPTQRVTTNGPPQRLLTQPIAFWRHMTMQLWIACITIVAVPATSRKTRPPCCPWSRSARPRDPGAPSSRAGKRAEHGSNDLAGEVFEAEGLAELVRRRQGPVVELEGHHSLEDRCGHRPPADVPELHRKLARRRLAVIPRVGLSLWALAGGGLGHRGGRISPATGRRTRPPR